MSLGAPDFAVSEKWLHGPDGLAILAPKLLIFIRVTP